MLIFFFNIVVHVVIETAVSYTQVHLHGNASLNNLIEHSHDLKQFSY